jgi:tetratricopeptide (TPR) repeat protein
VSAIAVLTVLGALQTAAAAQSADPVIAGRYHECVTQVRASPQQGIEIANAWRIAGGGVYARQCLALAYVALQRWTDAAESFEQGARDAGPQDARSADFWVQAGNAWLAGGEATRAVQAFDSAIATNALSEQLRGEVRLDRARALVALGSVAPARSDLDQALRLVPDDPMAWYLSAGLARRQHDLARARSDIARARTLAPDNPDIMLLSGTIAGEAGDLQEAERIYRQVVAAAPDSEAGHAAAASLGTAHDVEVPAASAPSAPSATGTPAGAASPSATAPASPVPARQPASDPHRR